jgi:hypothetical protein
LLVSPALLGRLLDNDHAVGSLRGIHAVTKKKRWWGNNLN